MNSRRSFLQLLGIAPAAALVPKAMLDSGKASNIPIHTSGYAQLNGGMQANAQNSMIYNGPPPTMRYLGYAQLKNEGDVVSFDQWQGWSA
jgi:hypothetical protein